MRSRRGVTHDRIIDLVVETISSLRAGGDNARVAISGGEPQCVCQTCQRRSFPRLQVIIDDEANHVGGAETTKNKRKEISGENQGGR